MSGTIVLFDRSIDKADLAAWSEYERIVLVRCTIRDCEFRPPDEVVAVDCRFERADMYSGMFWGCAFVRSQFVESNLSADFTFTHVHECTFTDCQIHDYGPDDEPEFLNVHFTECTFVNSGVPRVLRSRADDRTSMCSHVESREHRLARVDYVMRHTRDRNLDVVGPISFGVPLLDHAVHAACAYTSQEICQRDLARGWPVFVDCEFAEVAVDDLGVAPVFVGCKLRDVVLNDVVYGADFVECEFVGVDWAGPFTNSRFVRCTFRRCRFARALDPRPEDFDDSDFDVRFDSCAFERCEPATLR